MSIVSLGDNDSGRLIVTVDAAGVAPLVLVDCAGLLFDAASLLSGLSRLAPEITVLPVDKAVLSLGVAAESSVPVSLSA